MDMPTKPTVKCGMKWKPQQAVREAESYWKDQEIIGMVCQGRLGLGNFKTKSWSKAKGRRTRVVQRVREATEEDRLLRAVGFASQGQWMPWDQALERSLSWKELWSTDQCKLTFFLHAVADLLPTPTNLKIWGPGRGSILQARCPNAVGEGHYRWRPDKVHV